MSERRVRQTPPQQLTAPAAPATADHAFLQHVPNRGFLIGNVVLAVFYTLVITFAFEHGNTVLFVALIATEVFHLAQIVGYCWTVWGRDGERPFDQAFDAPVDVFITVCGEPVDVVRRTAMLVPHMNAAPSRLLPAMIGPKNSVCWSQATLVIRFWSWLA